MPQLPNRELFEPVGNGGEEEGELEVVEKIRKTVATIVDQSFIDVIYHKICYAILPWHCHLTMQEAKDDFVFYFW